MQENKYLNEANYNKTKKKLRTWSLIVLIIGLLIGGGLITTGIVLTNNIKRQNQEAAQQTNQSTATQRPTTTTHTVDEIQADINATQSQIDSLSAEITQLRTQQQQVFLDDQGFSERYQALGSEISTKQSQMANLEQTAHQYRSELMLIQSGVNSAINDAQSNAEAADKEINLAKNRIEEHKYVFLYIIGGMVIFIACIASFYLYIISKGREIISFTAQQYMPVAQEGINTMAPTIGNAAGTVAEGIARGIKKGISTPEGSPEQHPKQPTPPNNQ